MATKKQKREAALAKREEFLADEKARGLAAQQAGRRSDAEERKRMSEFARKVNIRNQDTINRIATAVEKKQIERELKGIVTEASEQEIERAEAVLFNRGNRV